MEKHSSVYNLQVYSLLILRTFYSFAWDALNEKRNNFISPFIICVVFVSFSYLITPDGACDMTLEKRNDGAAPGAPHWIRKFQPILIKFFLLYGCPLPGQNTPFYS